MVNYSASAAALLALTSLATTAINAENSNSIRPDSSERQGLRKLTNDEHEVTDVQTKCDAVIEGNPKVCVKVCVEVTTTTRSNGLIDEYSQVSQHKCDEGWENGGSWSGSAVGPIEWPPKWPTPTSPDGWKCAPKPVKKSWSTPEDEWKPPLWSVDEAKNQSSMESSGGKASKSSKGKMPSSKGLRGNGAWDAPDPAPAPAPAPNVWSGGARRLSVNQRGAKRILEWPSWPSPSGWKKTAAPSICNTMSPTVSNSPSEYPTISNSPSEYPTISNSPSEYPTTSNSPSRSPTDTIEEVNTPSPTTPPPIPPVELITPSPTTCQERNWYYSGGFCTNGYDEDGPYSNLLTCCEQEQQGGECKFKDVCCEMRPWYFSGGICTNGIAPEGDLFATVLKCCEEVQIANECQFVDVCNPVPEVVVTPVPTYQLTFGSTPTVSKEVTGPPTRGRS